MNMRLNHLYYGLRMVAKIRGFAPAAVMMAVLGLPAGVLVCAAAEKPQAETGPSVAARWEGVVQIPGVEMKLVIDLAQDNKGNWAGSATVPGFNVKGVPLSDVAVKGLDVAFAIKGVLGDPKFKGHLTTNDTLTGDCQEGGNTAPFVLQRAGPPQVEPQRQSTAIRKELEGEWYGDFELMGKKFRAQVTVANQAGGAATGKFHISGDAELTIPVELVTDDGDALTLESRPKDFNYQGRLDRNGTEIIGSFHLQQFDLPLTLRRAAANSQKTAN